MPRGWRGPRDETSPRGRSARRGRWESRSRRKCRRRSGPRDRGGAGRRGAGGGAGERGGEGGNPALGGSAGAGQDRPPARAAEGGEDDGGEGGRRHRGSPAEGCLWRGLALVFGVRAPYERRGIHRPPERGIAARRATASWSRSSVLQKANRVNRIPSSGRLQKLVPGTVATPPSAVSQRANSGAGRSLRAEKSARM